MPASDCLEKYNSFLKCRFPAFYLVSGCKLSPTKMLSFRLANSLNGLRSPSKRTFMAWNVLRIELKRVLKGLRLPQSWSRVQWIASSADKAFSIRYHSWLKVSSILNHWILIYPSVSLFVMSCLVIYLLQVFRCIYEGSWRLIAVSARFRRFYGKKGTINWMHYYGTLLKKNDDFVEAKAIKK